MPSLKITPRAVRVLLAVSILALTVVNAPVLRAQNGAAQGAIAPNYELAAQWTAQ